MSNTYPTSDDDPRSSSEFQRVSSVRQRYEAAWQAGMSPRIEEYLSDTPEHVRLLFVRELIAVDLKYRSLMGEQPAWEEYRRRFPAYAEALRDLFRTTWLNDAGREGSPASSGASSPSGPEVTVDYQPPAIDEHLTSKKPLPREAGPSPSMPRIPGYEVLRELGRGGMGLVYLARQESLGRNVALKVLPPALACDPLRLKRFRNEAEVAARLTDCRIVSVLDVLEADGTPVLAMPFIEGCTLSKILLDRAEVRVSKKVTDPHPWATLGDKAYLEQILPVLDMVLESVVALHDAGVLHRDIKPSNILIDRRNNAWLSDFGLARLASQALVTMPGEGLGTSGYMSPEQWEGKEDIDQLADVFSVGAALYKTLTLELPYGKERVTADTALPVPPSKRQPLLSRDFDAVLQKALEPERRNRYGSAKELQADWRRVRQGLFPRARRVGWMGRMARHVRRHRWTAVATLVAFALCVVGFALGNKRVSSGRKVELETDPPGAQIVLIPTDEDGVFMEKQAITSLSDVPAGYYLNDCA
jgi:serine/threonine protein kinase